MEKDCNAEACPYIYTRATIKLTSTGVGGVDRRQACHNCCHRHHRHYRRSPRLPPTHLPSPQPLASRSFLFFIFVFVMVCSSISPRPSVC